MEIIELKERNDLGTDPKLDAAYRQMAGLIAAMRKVKLKPEVLSAVNENIEQVNASSLGGRDLAKLVKSQQSAIVKTLEKEMKVVPKNYYRTMWTVVGMSAFGLPLGVAFGMAMKNMGMLGIGLPIGMAIGMAVGSGMDKKAAQEGRQLDIELKA